MKTDMMKAELLPLAGALGKKVICHGTIGWLAYNQQSGEYEIASVVGKVMKTFMPNQKQSVVAYGNEIVIRIRQ